VTALVWFRRDLRLHDHPALIAALDGHGTVVPVFCLDERLLLGRHASGPRTQFLLECLADLGGELARRGSRLVVRLGRPEQVLPALARRVGAREVHFTRDVTPFARRRGAAVRAALRAVGVGQVSHPGLTVLGDVGAVCTKAGSPYTVFSPFYRAWEAAERGKPLAAPSCVPGLPDGVEGEAPPALPTLAELGLEQEVTAPQVGGEQAAMERLSWFLDGPIERYARDRDALDVDGTSRLGAYLHFGCLSPRAVEAALPDGAGAAAFRRQLCWRDFYHHVQQHHPENAHREHQRRYRGTVRWAEGERSFVAWTAGLTGFPLVDAAMRQLLREGWMHNRARLVAGAFLTKHLGIDWRRGEAWFMRLLLDGDQANNNGNWQWIASVGVDPQPVYRRIYNPTRHLERYDPNGQYVRSYVPELRRVPQQYIAEPWTMPEHVQRAAGCIIGSDYPWPIVDLRESRAEALARYAQAIADGSDGAPR
jgi:deoxyribodipyrimidine photo-lyase